MTIEERLRAEIAASGLSFGEIARRSGVSLQVVCRFAHGGGLRLDKADKLAAAFGLVLVKAVDTEENANG